MDRSMKKLFASSVYTALILFLSSAFLTGCAAVGAIFGAGFYTGIFVVIAVIIVVVVLVARAGRK